MATTKSKILVIGGTGDIGKYIVEASAKAGHPTFALVRESTLFGPSKSKIIDTFKSLGVHLLTGDLHDYESLVKAIKQVDVVISTVGFGQFADQHKIIAAIQEAGNVKRFLPSEFASDMDRSQFVEPAKSIVAVKVNLRRTIEAAGIPYTYVSSNGFAGHLVPFLREQLLAVAPPRDKVGALAPPRDKVIILGDAKAVFNKEEDIASYTIKAVDDPRTLNKTLYIRPPGNIHSLNDIVSLWEKKIGKTLERVYISEEQLLKNIQEATPPLDVFLSLGHSLFVNGDHTNFEIEPSFGVEASELYSDIKYTKMDEYLNQFV